MRYILIMLIAVVALAASACGGDDEEDTENGAVATETESDELAGEPVEVELEILEGEGETATATLTPVAENETGVDIVYPTGGAGEEVAHPAHVHEGGCGDELGAIAYPLEDISGGSSQSTLDVGLEELQEGDFAINVHRSAEEIDVYLACGEIQ